MGWTPVACLPALIACGVQGCALCGVALLRRHGLPRRSPAAILPIISTHDILAELPRLSSEERTRLAQVLRDLAADGPALILLPGPRMAGLHEGAWDIADDFDDPLPDEFWLGEDA